jgi:hypothetical protein
VLLSSSQLRYDISAIRIMGSGFAAITFSSSKNAECAYKQNLDCFDPPKKEGFMEEYRNTPSSTSSFLEWRLLQPGTAMRFAAQSDAVGQYPVAVGYSDTTGWAAKAGSGAEAKGALGFVNPERMALIDGGGGSAAPSRGRGRGKTLVAPVSRTKAVSSQIAQVGALRVPSVFTCG